MTILASNTVRRALEPVFHSLPLDVAQQIASLQMDESLQTRAEQLARKANEDELSAEEREEYAAYVEAGDVFATMQALARRRLKQDIA